MQPKDAASKTSEVIDTYLKPFFPLFKYLLVALILYVAYKKIILPFAERMLEFSREAGQDPRECSFHSDSIYDLPLLAEVGEPVAVNPDFRLRRIATGTTRIPNLSISVM